MTSVQTNDMTATTFQGWANWETWNAALWIGNDEFLYNTAKACVTFREGLETPWDKFVRCMTDGQIGRHLISTPCLLYTSPSPRDKRQSRMPSSA